MSPIAATIYLKVTCAVRIPSPLLRQKIWFEPASGSFLVSTRTTHGDQATDAFDWAVQQFKSRRPVLAGTGNTVTIGSSASAGLSGINADLRVQGLLGQTPHVILDDSADPMPRTIDLGSDAAFGYPAGTFGYIVSGLADTSQGRGRIGFEIDPAAPVSMLGGPADDIFRIRDFAGAPAISLVAEPAGSTRTNQHNKLDYSAYVGTVKVNLPLGTATGLAAISGIQDVTAGQGNGLLVGDAQANILIGGTGRNILIGGTTDFDTNLPALNAIFAEWTRTDLSFCIFELTSPPFAPRSLGRCLRLTVGLPEAFF
jgi:hypothetical protein